MLHVLYELFGWPAGIVVGNLAADGLTFTAGVLVGRRTVRKLHATLAAHREAGADTHRLVAELHAHQVGDN